MLIPYHPFTRNLDEWVLFHSQPLEYLGTQKIVQWFHIVKMGVMNLGFRDNIISVYDSIKNLSLHKNNTNSCLPDIQ
jgi:hypothetical protein